MTFAKYFITALLALVLFSCSKNDDDNPVSGNELNFQTNAVFNSNLFETITFDYGVAYYSKQDGKTKIVLVDSLFDLVRETPEKEMTITCEALSEGTFDLSKTENRMRLELDNQMYFCKSGEIVISEFQPSGGILKLTVKEAVFNYQNQDPLEINSNEIKIGHYSTEDLNEVRAELEEIERKKEELAKQEWEERKKQKEEIERKRSNKGLNPYVLSLRAEQSGELFSDRFLIYSSISNVQANYNYDTKRTEISITGVANMNDSSETTLYIGYDGTENPAHIDGLNNENYVNFNSGGKQYRMTEGDIIFNEFKDIPGERLIINIFGYIEDVDNNNKKTAILMKVDVARTL